MKREERIAFINARNALINKINKTPSYNQKTVKITSGHPECSGIRKETRIVLIRSLFKNSKKMTIANMKSQYRHITPLKGLRSYLKMQTIAQNL